VSQINTGAQTIHRPERTKVELSDAVEIREALENTYGVRLRLHENRMRNPDERLTHERVDVGSFAIEHVHFPGDIEVSPDPLNRVLALWNSAGKLEGHCDGIKGEAAPGEVCMIAQPDLPHYAHVEDVTVTLLLLDPAVVASVATGLPLDQAARSIRFDEFRPVSRAAAHLWKSTVEYVKNGLLADDAAATPLVLGQASRLLAAVMVSTFPSNLTIDESRLDRVDGTKPALLRRAIEYMDANVDNDIALADIADAIHVTPRAVQYMFRKHLDTTPLQYLRRVRLHHAHQDLLRADRMHDTVTAIAARWGFMHSGRFAVLYRQVYGQSPHTTLRG